MMTIKTMTVSKLALLICLTGASSLAFGQNNSSTPATDPQPAAVHDLADRKDNHSDHDETGSDCQKEKNKARNKKKHAPNPTPSKQEQEFQKMLQGIYG